MRILCPLALAFLFVACKPIAPMVSFDTSAAPPTQAERLVTLQNEARAAAGVPAMRFSLVAELAAAIRAEDMERDGYVAHVDPDGTPGGFGEVLIALGAVNWVEGGENAGYNNYEDPVARVMADWRTSSSHWANVLFERWDSVGCATRSFGVRETVAVCIYLDGED